MNNDESNQPAVQIAITWEKGKVSEITTNSRQVNHFLDLMKMSRAYNTWVSYAQDLKVFFKVIVKTPGTITRADCLEFMKQQDQAGCSGATINRRLAAISSLFNELCLLEPEHFSRNPVYPRQGYWESKRRGQSLYRKQAQPIPNILSEHELRTFFRTLHSWRDRTLVLLMWISCLRISEAVNIRFQDVVCSRRSVYIPVAKGNRPRTVFMDELTFTALNQYLDLEPSAPWLGTVAAQVFVVLAIRLALAARFNLDFWTIVLHPFAMGVFCGIALNSVRWVLVHGGARWKGRTYNFRNQRGA